MFEKVSLMLLVIVYVLSAQAGEYPFVVVDSPPVVATMRQSDVTYLSLYRLSTDFLYDRLDDRWALGLDACLSGLLYMPLTHEEGHRSVLTVQGIGAISKPYFNKYGAAYVTGVTDSTLKELRNTDLPTYIRLHTAGLESDYALLAHEREILITQKDRNLRMEYTFRRFSHFTYLFLSIFPSLSPELEEESNELDRDIVGHDVWGMVRHLHRPDMDFYRYTDYKDLTPDEEDFIRRIALMSLINLADPAMIQLYGTKDIPDLLLTGGYTIVPFGDMAEIEAISAKGAGYRAALRVYGNRSRAFAGLSLGIGRIRLSDKLSVYGDVEMWQQPKGLDFCTRDGELGAGGNLFIGFQPKDMPLIIEGGLTAKTSGFMMENMYLDDHIGGSIQVTYIRE